jgi:subtilisin-like proprotein convertase family protein
MIDEVRIANYVKTPEEIQKGMYISIDANNEPNPGNVNVAYSFEGTLDGTDGAPAGAWAGTGIIRFTQTVNNSLELPILTDRHDAGNYPGGYRYHYADLAFGSAPTTVLDSIFMPQSLTITDVNVFVGIHHAYANDVSLTLRNPSGSTSRILYAGAGPDIGQNMITIFDDQADSTANANLRAPWSPRVKPANALSIFNTQNSLGWWRLSATDIFPSADNGVLVGWGIQFNNLNVTAAEQQSSQIPFKYALHQNYPNPFNPTTTIKYDIPKEGIVKIIIYDILGKEVMTLVNENKKAGSYTILFNAGSLASGVYFYNIEAGTFKDSKRMILVK